jgi:DNA polymerase delta subunit 4
MPPKTRRSRGGPAAQTTLSFNNKVTKSHTANPIDKASKPKSRLSDPVVKEALVEQVSQPDPEPTTISLNEPASTKGDTDKHSSDEQQTPSSPVLRKKKRVSGGSVASQEAIARETAAEKITDAQIKKYWKAEEESRLAPRGKLPSRFISSSTSLVFRSGTAPVS